MNIETCMVHQLHVWLTDKMKPFTLVLLQCFVYSVHTKNLKQLISLQTVKHSLDLVFDNKDPMLLWLNLDMQYKKKLSDLLTYEVLLLHDNAKIYFAIHTQNLIRSFGRKQIDHPLYSSDLFLYIKEFLGG